MTPGLAVTGGRAHGVYFVRSAGLTIIKTDREPGAVVDVVAGVEVARCTFPGGAVEVQRAGDEAAFARWACRLATELGTGVEMRVTKGEA